MAPQFAFMAFTIGIAATCIIGVIAYALYIRR
jgi:hypothetical protein